MRVKGSVGGLLCSRRTAELLPCRSRLVRSMWAETAGEAASHDQYSAVYFTSAQALAHSGLEHTHRTTSQRFSFLFRVPVKERRLTLRHAADDADVHVWVWNRTDQNLGGRLEPLRGDRTPGETGPPGRPVSSEELIDRDHLTISQQEGLTAGLSTLPLPSTLIP